MPFDFSSLIPPGLILVRPRLFHDDRGSFAETYKSTDFYSGGINQQFIQENQSHSVKGVLRGLHYQNPPKSQGKLIRCLNGIIFDVAVDIRKGSPYYGEWTGVELTGDNSYMLYIPPGFAHGFLTMSSEADVLYKTTGEYSPEHEAGIRWDDSDIGIEWPFTEGIIVSSKDSELPRLNEAVNLFTY